MLIYSKLDFPTKFHQNRTNAKVVHLGGFWVSYLRKILVSLKMKEFSPSARQLALVPFLHHSPIFPIYTPLSLSFPQEFPSCIRFSVVNE